MPERGEGGPLEGVDAIPWNTLQTAYGEAGTVPATLTKLASRDRDVADQGHAEIYDLGLIHQLTIYTATAAAMPFIARIAASPDSVRRPRLVTVLADASLGKDVPYSPAGTTAAVRRAVREILPLLRRFMEAPDRAMRLAMADLAAALPFDLPDAKPLVMELFRHETSRTTRAALAGALALLGDRSSDVMDPLLEAERRSIHRGIRRGEFVFIPAELAAGKDMPGAEDVIGLPVYQEVLEWMTKSSAGADDDLFLEAARSVHELFMDDHVYYEVAYNAP
ncbi:MAG: hypothetical protein E6I37_10225 [Chloroflexi bacterium]|nr:MAG: hypothetical protein E6I37_10225 [Chloroflexota bacterium]